VPGPSNSLSALKNERSAVESAGVDSWSICWYLREGSSAQRALEALATVPAPRSRLIEESVLGHRVGWFPGTRMLFAEGHPDPGGLCKPEALVAVKEHLESELQDRGVWAPQHRLSPLQNGRGDILRVTGGTGFGGVRRLDATVDLSFADPLEGLCALAGVAALPLARMQTEIRREAGGRRIETVYFRGYGGVQVLGRWYDKGFKELGRRGVWVRPEDQRRFTARARPGVEDLATTSYVRDSFVRRFEPLWRAAKGVKVGGATELAKRLAELVDQGAISPTAANRIAGHLVLEAANCQRQSPATCRRHRADARDHGLVLADGILDEVEVDLGDILERAMDSECWGQQG
jgi:hypothetical protein